MIKIFKYAYVNILCFPLFVIFYLNGHFNYLLISYSIIILHELSHLLTALFIGLKPECIEIHPFGVCLKLKNKIVRSLADEIILYMSGPLSNILMALITKTLLYSLPNAKHIYLSNIMLFAINMLPIVPLDGGIIFKKLLSYKLGCCRAEKYSKYISCIICFLLICTGLLFVYQNKFNYSLLIISVTAACSIFTQKEKYDIEYLKKLIFYTDKKNPNTTSAKILVHHSDTDLRKTASEFNSSSYSIVCVVDEKDNIVDWLTEKQVLNSLLK